MKKVIVVIIILIVLSLLLTIIEIHAILKKTKPEANKPFIVETYPAPVSVLGRYEEKEDFLKPNYKYSLNSFHEINGRQGVAYVNEKYYVSGSTLLTCYDKDWKYILSNDKPFDKISENVNHIGDIDVYNGEIYAGIETFMSGESENIKIAIYDAETLKLKKTYEFDKESGQTEVSGIAVDPDTKSIWMCSWADGESGRYLYRYDLESFKYLGKYHLQAPPQWIQGIAYLDGYIYISADDGNADEGEADHIYHVKVDLDKTNFPVVIERTLDDVSLQGEMEGLSFDKDNHKLLISYNRGHRIILGEGNGMYEGYNRELHEIYVYDMEKY